jgi:hypothetical protein
LTIVDAFYIFTDFKTKQNFKQGLAERSLVFALSTITATWYLGVAAMFSCWNPMRRLAGGKEKGGREQE